MRKTLVIAALACFVGSTAKAAETCELSRPLKIAGNDGGETRLPKGTIVEVVSTTPKQRVLIRVMGSDIQGWVRQGVLAKACPSVPDTGDMGGDTQAAGAAGDEATGGSTSVESASVVAPPPTPAPAPAPTPAPVPVAKSEPVRVAQAEAAPQPRETTWEKPAKKDDDDRDAERMPENETHQSGSGESAFSGMSEMYVGATARGFVASGNPGMLLGGRFGMSADRRLQIGIAGAISVLPSKMQQFNGASFRNERYLDLGYIGPELTFNIINSGPYAVAARGLAGFGFVAHHSKVEGDMMQGPDLMFIAEPGMVVSTALSEGMTLVMGVGYHVVYGVGLDGFGASTGDDPNRINGVSFDLGVDFTL